MDHGRQRQCGIGRAAGNHHVGAGRQRLGEWERSDICVGALDAVADRRDRRARVHIAHLVALLQKVVETIEDVVPEHHRDLEAGRQAHHLSRARHRIHAACVGDHFDAALPDLSGYACDQWRKIACVSEFRVGLLLLLQDRHRDLGQVVERQIVDGPLLHQADRRFQPVAPESLPVRDADHGRRSAPGFGIRDSGFETSGLFCSMQASRANISVLRVSRGSITASQWPLAAAYFASSQRS